MKLGLKDKTAVVGGASKGMGLAIATALAAEGARVCLIARGEENLKKAAEGIKAAGHGEVMFFAADMADPTIPEKVFSKVEEEWGAVDILINNAGGPPPGSFLEKTEADWESALQQNFLSVVRMTKRAVPVMKRNKWGRILNLTSYIQKEPTAEMVLSASARSAVSAFSKAVSIELAPYNITINTVAPGGFLTDRMKNLLQSKADKNKTTFEKELAEGQGAVSMKRFGRVEEIADVFAFLASERGSYVTGTTLVVDGGLTKAVY